jgi:acyl-CoA thioester hydrolase
MSRPESAARQVIQAAGVTDTTPEPGIACVSQLFALNMTFSLPIVVRGYELDALGHVNQAVYLQYVEHVRWEGLRAAGIDQAKIIASGFAPVVLEQTVRYRRELRGGDEITVSCATIWGEGKTFRFHHEIRKLDGTLSAEVDTVTGMMDLTARKLVPDPREHFRKLADNPDLIDL